MWNETAAASILKIALRSSGERPRVVSPCEYGQPRAGVLRMRAGSPSGTEPRGGGLRREAGVVAVVGRADLKWPCTRDETYLAS